MGDIVVPTIFTEFHEAEVGLHVPTHEELVRKIIHNNNFLINLVPVGTIMFINVNQKNVTIPSSSLWQECDGAEITNPNSPLRSLGVFLRFTPNLRDKYMRGANTTNGNSSGGSHTYNLQHTHNTGFAGGSGVRLDDKGPKFKAQAHNHTIPEQYSDSEIVEAAAFNYAIAYMKII